MTSVAIHDAMIVTRDVNNPILERGHVLVEDGLITAVESAASHPPFKAARVIDGSSRLLAPGLINAHTHSQSSTMSGFADRLSHSAFMWLTQAYTSGRRPDEIRLAVLLTAYGMLTTGTTAAIDHFPGQRFAREDMDAVLSAWRETGMRVALGMRFFDGAFSDIFPDKPLPDALRDRMSQFPLLKPQGVNELRELMTETIQRWHGCDDRLSVYPAPSNPDRCSDEAILLCAELAEKFDTGIHTHLLETSRQASLARDRYGRSTVEHLDALGVLSSRWSCAHCIWLTDEDLDLFVGCGAVAVLNPESNARIGAGTARIPEMQRRGVKLALGSDGSGTNDNLVLHEAMRAVATMHRASERNRELWITAEDALRMATEGGAAALRHPRLGIIAKGYAADLVLYRLDRPWWIPINDPVNQLVYSETGASVDTVLVDGKVVVEHGHPTCFDAAALVREIRDMAASLRKRNDHLFAVANEVAELVP